jgi:hypothetical protein
MFSNQVAFFGQPAVVRQVVAWGVCARGPGRRRGRHPACVRGLGLRRIVKTLHARGDEGQSLSRPPGLEQPPRVGCIRDPSVTNAANGLGLHGPDLVGVVAERGDFLLLQLDELRQGDLATLPRLLAHSAFLVESMTQWAEFLLELGNPSGASHDQPIRLDTRLTLLVERVAQRAEFSLECRRLGGGLVRQVACQALRVEDAAQRGELGVGGRAEFVRLGSGQPLRGDLLAELIGRRRLGLDDLAGARSR